MRPKELRQAERLSRVAASVGEERPRGWRGWLLRAAARLAVIAAERYLKGGAQ